MWKPSFFGVKPTMIIKGGVIARRLWVTQTHQYQHHNQCIIVICSGHLASQRSIIQFSSPLDFQ